MGTAWDAANSLLDVPPVYLSHLLLLCSATRLLCA